MTCRLSRSGARIRGDDYHHLFAWTQVLYAIQGHSEITALGIEDPDAGNADDVTVYKDNGECEFFQAKSSADANEPISTDWLMKPSKSSGPSVIQGFHKLWVRTLSNCRPKLTLVTNRLPANRDPILSLRDGRNGIVVRSLKLKGPNSRAGKALKTLANHLSATEEDTLTFLADLRFILGRLDDEWKQEARTQMYMAGLRYDEDAVQKGIYIVHNWVTEGKRKLTIDDLHRAVEPLKRSDDLPAASLLIQAIDHDPMPDFATIVLDWTDKFPGEEPKTRRLPLDQAFGTIIFAQTSRRLRKSEIFGTD